MKDTKEQIRAMLESGFSNAQIRNFLGVSYEDIESVKNSQQEEELKLEEPETSETPETPETPETHKLERVGRNGTKVNEENYKLIKQDIESGVKRLEIRRKFNISDALYYRVKKSKTYEDFCNIRKIEADKKRKQTGGDFKVDDGEYHTRKKEPKYTEEIWNEGKKMHSLGIPYREIAARQGFSENYVAKVLRLPSYDALVNIRKEEQAKRKAEFERTKAMVEAEMESLNTQLDEVAPSEPEKKSELPEPVVQERVEMPYTGRRADTHRPTKVTKRVFDSIKERYLNGETTRQLADDTKLGRGTINRIAQANNIDEYFSKRAADRAKYRKTKKTEKTEISPELIELRTMNDYLARIVEALESKPKKRGWFRK